MQHCAGFISAELLYMFRASSPIISSIKKTATAAPGTGVIVAGSSSHHHTPDDGGLTPETCRVTLQNKTCTVLHQVGVLFDLYYNAWKHKSKNVLSSV
jgi:hypothetical protein